MYVETVHDRTTRPCLTFGWDLTEYYHSSHIRQVSFKLGEGQRASSAAEWCSNRDIRLNIEMRCARRKMMRHTSAIVAVPSQANTRLPSIGVTWSTNALGACSYALDCNLKTAAESWSDRASFPGKRKRSAHEEGLTCNGTRM